ncbi:hypothetical protein, partial [Candidatus Phycosocius spiralis]|uniref:hypothetical protein n=1 Tax=Candidatus Phycosocius spiralis TaxID=2815099 RepID=UPI0024E0E198
GGALAGGALAAAAPVCAGSVLAAGSCAGALLAVRGKTGGFNSVLCHLRLGPFGIRVLCRNFPWLDEEVWHESIEVHGRPESVRR